MVNISTEFAVQLCEGVTSLCLNNYLEAVILCLNGICLIFNIIHLAILSHFGREIAEKKYFTVLKHITMSDIAIAIGYFLTIPCWIREIAISSKVIVSFIDSSAYIGLLRYSIMAIATTERLIALRSPFSFSTNVFIKKLNIWLTLVWSIPLPVICISGLFSMEELCINVFFGMSATANPIYIITSIIFILIPSLAMFVGLVMIMKQIFKLGWLNSLHQRDRQLLKTIQAAKFITSISILYVFLCIMPSGVIINLLCF